MALVAAKIDGDALDAVFVAHGLRESEVAQEMEHVEVVGQDKRAEDGPAPPRCRVDEPSRQL